MPEAAQLALTESGISRAIDAAFSSAAVALQGTDRSARGQFFTPPRIAALMASLSTRRRSHLRILDAGAGVGVLTATLVDALTRSPARPETVEVTAFEIDENLGPALRCVLEAAARSAAANGIDMQFTVRRDDFIVATTNTLAQSLFAGDPETYDCAILNPPYRKIRTDSPERRLLRDAGIEATNLYAAFVALSLRLLVHGGELIAITPRSFCNGPYFAPFRKDILRLSSLTHLHLFDARDEAFGADGVLQENVIFRLERGASQAPSVCVEWSHSGDRAQTVRRPVPFAQVVHPHDRDAFIHISPSEWDSHIATTLRQLTGSLADLGLAVSTGRVVDFRFRDDLRADPDDDAVPLVYPNHLRNGSVVWPAPGGRKPNALRRRDETEALIHPPGNYVLVKRFSSKEERRRVTAAVLTPDAVDGAPVAFENHLNYFHRRGWGLPRPVAAGLAAYLNSTLVDAYFRQFSGHTQINATDLRKLPYPTAEQVSRIGELVDGRELTQLALDELVEQELLSMPTKSSRAGSSARRRIDQAVRALTALRLPKEQTNERAALTLLALADLPPSRPWSKTGNPLCRVTPIMEFAARHYGKEWKPNTRETVRRFTLHQFQDAGLVVANPDQPTRPVNSPAYCYQLSEQVLQLLRSFGTPAWRSQLRTYLASAPALKSQYASERSMQKIALQVREGISLSPGGQNSLVKHILDEFCPRFVPGATPLYVGDAGKKWAYLDADALAKLGVTLNPHGKIPDVIVHLREKNWLVLVEAVTSHGPVNAKRRRELARVFADSKAPLVYVSAFPSRRVLNRFLAEIAWETEAWVADSPSHLIHFNGERFLGPYE